MKKLFTFILFAATITSVPAVAQDKRQNFIVVFASMSSSESVCGHPLARDWLEVAITGSIPAGDTTFVSEIYALDEQIRVGVPSWPTGQREQFCAETLNMLTQSNLLR